MVKIIGIVAMVFMYNWETNAELDYVNGTAASWQRVDIDTTKSKMESNSTRRTKLTTVIEWERYLQANLGDPPSIERDLRDGEALDNNLNQSANETSEESFKKYETEVKEEIEKYRKKKTIKKIKMENKQNEHVDRSSPERQKYDKEKIGMEKNKDSKDHEVKDGMEQDKHNIFKTLKRHGKPPDKKKKASKVVPKAFSKRSTRSFNDANLLVKRVEQEVMNKEHKHHRIRNDWGKKHLIDGENFAHGSLRSTKMMALQEEEEENKRLYEEAVNSGGTPPLTVSPYAIKSQFNIIMNEFPFANTTFETLGRTIEYNDILLAKITDVPQKKLFRTKDNKYSDDGPEKKIIFIVHGLTVMGMPGFTSLSKMSQLHGILTYYLQHLDKFDFFVILLANPDGYCAALNSDGIWNKNLSPQAMCSGVFLDRNFDVGWNYTSRKISSCSQLFPGVRPFSEIETRVIRDVFHRYGHKILAYIHVHPGTFGPSIFKGEAVLYPRGYTSQQSNDDFYIDVKAEIDEAMKNASFRVMTVTVDTLYNWYGEVTGTSVDYAATVYGIPHAMEFVMQPYDDETLNTQALMEIWSRIIDITLQSMWKNLHKDAK